MAEKRWAVARGGTAILFLLTGILVVGCGHGYDYKLEVTETRTWPAAEITRISATTENGGITVEATQDTVIAAVITRTCRGKNKAEAEDHIDNVVVEDNIAGGTLTLTADMPTGTARNYGASFEISAPEPVYLELVTSNGEISLSRMVAGADATTSNGGISLEDTGGYVELHTSNGAVNLERHDGGVTANTSNGNIDCDIVELGGRESATLSTSNGNVTLSLPPDVSTRFDATTSNGQVSVTGFADVTYTVNEPTHKAGRIGEGDSEVTITTSNGNITIRAR